jgi:hypothetical protein
VATLGSAADDLDGLRSRATSLVISFYNDVISFFYYAESRYRSQVANSVRVNALVGDGETDNEKAVSRLVTMVGFGRASGTWTSPDQRWYWQATSTRSSQ